MILSRRSAVGLGMLALLTMTLGGTWSGQAIAAPQQGPAATADPPAPPQPETGTCDGESAEGSKVWFHFPSGVVGVDRPDIGGGWVYVDKTQGQGDTAADMIRIIEQESQKTPPKTVAVNYDRTSGKVNSVTRTFP